MSSTRGADPTPGSTITVGTKPAQTEYVVLERAAGESGWVEKARISSTSSAVAVKRHIDKAANSIDGTQYVAVPARSWAPVEHKTKTTTTTTLEPVK